WTTAAQFPWGAPTWTNLRWVRLPRIPLLGQVETLGTQKEFRAAPAAVRPPWSLRMKRLPRLALILADQSGSLRPFAAVSALNRLMAAFPDLAWWPLLLRSIRSDP